MEVHPNYPHTTHSTPPGVPPIEESQPEAPVTEERPVEDSPGVPAPNTTPPEEQPETTEPTEEPVADEPETESSE